MRPVGGATKLAWGALGDPVEVELSTAGLDRPVEHNAGDLTAVLEAGVPLARCAGARSPTRVRCWRSTRRSATAPTRRRSAGSSRAATPARCATATAAARDLVLGMTVALADGTVAKSGGKVIKNVAGYDLAKLFTGSFGTLGVILRGRGAPASRCARRDDAAPSRPATPGGSAASPPRSSHAHARDARRSTSAGQRDQAPVLARFAGSACGRPGGWPRAARWRRPGSSRGDRGRRRGCGREQREGQRSADGRRGARLRPARPTSRGVARARPTSAAATLVGRAALGISWLALADSRR